MAHLDAIATNAGGSPDWETLYWWRRDASPAAASAEPLRSRLALLAERAAPSPRPTELPGNNLQARARAPLYSSPAATAGASVPDPELVAAVRRERRSAAFALASGLVATAASIAAAIYSAAAHETMAVFVALAGVLAASFALYHAARWLLLLGTKAFSKLHFA